MRAATVIVTALGIAGPGLGGALAWRWRALPSSTPARDCAPETVPVALRSALRTLAALVLAGIFAGIVVLGLGGRLVMRVLAATSGEYAQGRRTEADEIVGEITLGGTVGFVVFAGVFGGLICAFGYLLARPWLPATPWRAGLVVGLVAVGTLGVGDPLDPDNSDFLILRPLWFAVLLLAATALLFGVTLTAVAARLEAALPLPGWRPGLVAYAPLALSLASPLAVPSAAYVIGRGLARGRLREVAAGRACRTAGRLVLTAGCAASAVLVALAVTEILRR